MKRCIMCHTARGGTNCEARRMNIGRWDRGEGRGEMGINPGEVGVGGTRG